MKNIMLRIYEDKNLSCKEKSILIYFLKDLPSIHAIDLHDAAVRGHLGLSLCCLHDIIKNLVAKSYLVSHLGKYQITTKLIY